jgi:hypothetical protein
MAKKPTSKVVRKSAKDLPPTSAADLDRLRAAIRGHIDTSDIPEREGKGEGGKGPRRQSGK